MGNIYLSICWLVLIVQVVCVFGKEASEADPAKGRSRSRRNLPLVNDIYTLDHFIELVEKIERKTEMSVKEIANSIRKLGYDDKKWTYLIGITTALDKLPSGVLNPEENRVLTNMIAHRYIGLRELGVVSTPTGNVAMGHVITGICAGIDRNRKLFSPRIKGLSIDNLFAATISGDLGQTLLSNQLNQSRPLFGPGGSWSPNKNCPATFNGPLSSKSEATDAEILGDIDGFLLGYNLPAYVSKQVRLGQLLRMYYADGILYDTSFASCKRNTKFRELVKNTVLKEQVEDFAKAYNISVWSLFGSSSVQDSLVSKLATETTNAFFLYLDSITSTTKCVTKNNEGCELPANIIFVMDDSGSIGSVNYETEKQFVIKVLDAFEISPIQTRVAVIEYSSGASVSIALDAYGSKTRLKCAVQKIVHNGGGTNTAFAVQTAYQIMKNEEQKSEGVQQIMILLTDGRSNSANALDQEVKLAKANLKGVTMIAVGVGNYDRHELEIIATDPKNHVLTSTDFVHLVDLVKTLRRKTCEAPARLTISFRTDDGENKTAVIGFVSPGKSRYYALPPELFYGIQNIYMEVTPFFGRVLVYASRIHKNPGPANYTFKIAPKGSSRKRRSTDSNAGAGEPLNLHVKDICRGYNETTCPPLYVAVQGTSSKLSCHESQCTLPNQIKFRIAKGYPSNAHWTRGQPSVVAFLVLIHNLVPFVLH